MIYVYRKQPSDGGLLLARALGGRKVRDTERFKAGDFVVCWGSRTDKPGIKALNNVAYTSKFKDVELLTAAGVATITVSKTKPAAQVPVPAAADPAAEKLILAQRLAEDFIDLQPADLLSRSAPLKDGVNLFHMALGNLRDLLKLAPPAAVVPIIEEWLPRLNSHVGGNDLLGGPIAQPDFWVKKESINVEYRVHSFQGRSLRAGKKIPVDGAAPHAWVRSLDGGWRISYDGVSVRQKHRDLAHAAVKALGLDFGAVDIAERPDGSLFVLEVNRAPGLDGGTIDVYAKAIKAWINGDAVPAGRAA